MRLFLVTGGAGFVGSHLVKAILAKGDRVRILDDLSSGKLENLPEALPVSDRMIGSITDAAVCQAAMEGVDYVLHHAAMASVPASVADPMRSHAVNLGGTLNLLLAAQAAGVKRFVFAGSSAVYGSDPELPKRESMRAEPMSPYAVQKLAAEQYCQVFSQLKGLETVVFRYFNIYGPGQDPNGPYSAVIPSFVTTCLSGEAPQIHGDGETSRDFVFIDDVVRANLLACEAPEAAVGQVMNIASGSQLSLNRLAAVIREAVGSGQPAQHGPERPGDVRHSVADTQKAEALIGFKAHTRFEAGIAKTVLAYRAAIGA